MTRLSGIGAHGAIAAILTAAPQSCVQLWDAVQRGDHAAALDLHKKLLRLWNAIAGDNLPANVKFAMELQGPPRRIPACADAAQFGGATRSDSGRAQRVLAIELA